MDKNNFDKETAKRYSAEGLDGLVKAVKANPMIDYVLNSDLVSSAESIKALLMMQIYSDSELRNRFNMVSIDITSDAIIKELLSDEQPEHKETDSIQKAVDYFKESKYYKAWLETDAGTEGGLAGAVLVAYALDGKFNELCRKADLNYFSAVAPVIVTRLMEQKHK